MNDKKNLKNIRKLFFKCYFIILIVIIYFL